MNPVDLPAPGFHYGVSFEDYTRWPAINFSRLKPIRHTASKCKWEMDHPKKPTPAMVLGSAIHVATLEPARFEQSFYIVPPCDRRTSEGKAEFAEHEKAAGNRLMIRQGSREDEGLLDDVEKLRAMAAAIRKSKAAAPFLNCEGQNEVSMLWQDAETQLWCKGRMDRFVPSFAKLDGLPVVVEIKTTRDAEPWSFGKDCDSMGYAAQAANYIAGVKVITGKTPFHLFIAVENEPPHDLQCHVLDDQSLQTGMLQYRTWLARYAQCLKSNQWPGYPDKLTVLSLPEYAHQRKYDN